MNVHRAGLGVILLAAAGLAQTKVPAGTPHSYKKVDGRELRLWVQAPATTEVRPAIVFFHGGGWVGGAPTALERQAKHLVARGMVAVLVEYRLLAPKTTDPPVVCIRDARSAMRWVRGHAAELHIDPKRIAASGGSAGGHLSAYVGLMDGIDEPGEDVSVSARANALVLFNPVLENGPTGWGRERTGADYLRYSPYHHVAPGAPPTIVLSGSDDKLIPAATLRNFQNAMRESGARCDLIIYEGQGHGFFNRDWPFDATLKAADEFLVSLGWLR
jgi:acetyl esterase